MRRFARSIRELLDHDTGYGPVWWFLLIVVAVAAIELLNVAGY